jgi:hypothetical protein
VPGQRRPSTHNIYDAKRKSDEIRVAFPEFSRDFYVTFPDTHSSWRNTRPVRLTGGWLLMLICSERKVLLACSGWFVLREKYYCPVADKSNE